MIYLPEHVDLIERGLKWHSRRLVKEGDRAIVEDGKIVAVKRRTQYSRVQDEYRIVYRVGFRYAVCAGRGKKHTCRRKLLAIYRENVWKISAEDIVAEGVAGEEAWLHSRFGEVWDGIHTKPGTRFRDEPEVWALVSERKVEEARQNHDDFVDSLRMAIPTIVPSIIPFRERAKLACDAQGLLDDHDRLRDGTESWMTNDERDRLKVRAHVLKLFGEPPDLRLWPAFIEVGDVTFIPYVGRHTGVALNAARPCSVCGRNFPFYLVTSYTDLGKALDRDRKGETLVTCQDCLWEKADAEEKNDG